MTRTTEEVFDDHLKALQRRDVAAIVIDYTDDVLVLTSQGVLKGRTGVEAFYRQGFDALPDVEFQIGSRIFGGDALLVCWTATASAGRVDDGVDTFVFVDGMIRLQSSSFTIEPNEAGGA